jgi:hypothetical protein
MPYLGDYLGQLLSEISIARLQADLETVRLAELYASHPLLRTMPVPHVRLPELSLELPVIVKDAEAPREGETTRGGVPLAEMRKVFDKTLIAHLAKAEIELSAEERSKLRTVLKERMAAHDLANETSIDVHGVADDLTSTAVRVVAEIRGPLGALAPEAVPKFEAELRETVRREFLKLRTPPPRLMVLVTTAEVREAGSTESLTRLRLTVAEQGVEWTTIESEGIRRDRLVPE